MIYLAMVLGVIIFLWGFIAFLNYTFEAWL